MFVCACFPLSICSSQLCTSGEISVKISRELEGVNPVKLSTEVICKIHTAASLIRYSWLPSQPYLIFRFKPIKYTCCHGNKYLNATIFVVFFTMTKWDRQVIFDFCFLTVKIPYFLFIKCWTVRMDWAAFLVPTSPPISWHRLESYCIFPVSKCLLLHFI